MQRGCKQEPPRECVMKERIIGPGKMVGRKKAFDVVPKNSYNQFNFIILVKLEERLVEVVNGWNHVSTEVKA